MLFSIYVCPSVYVNFYYFIFPPVLIHHSPAFVPPRHPAGIQALLQHSLESYGPLPPDLHRIRSRTQSRPSPYPHPHSIKTSISPDKTQPRIKDSSRSFIMLQTPTAALQQVSINLNIQSPALPTPPLDTLKSGSPFVHDDSKLVKMFGLPPTARPRVPSNARRTVLGWSKRSSGKGDNKENTFTQGLVMTPSESLRIDRPRPR